MTVGARATAPERIQVTYAAAAGCPGEDAFLADVALDGGRLVLARPDEPARSFALTLTADEGTGTARGRLIVRSLENVETRRDIEGAHCEDVARALAILVAVALLPTETPPVVPGSDASTTD
ncbi:MAG TPA: hypothetical protein VH044_07950, partial [Polyangiaceae bacterium]|nr:hypothetical protein [Polyangiaceae bacterium]